MSGFTNFKKIVKSKILRSRSQNDKMKNKMPAIINDLIMSKNNNVDIVQENNSSNRANNKIQESSYNHVYRYELPIIFFFR